MVEKGGHIQIKTVSLRCIQTILLRFHRLQYFISFLFFPVSKIKLYKEQLRKGVIPSGPAVAVDHADRTLYPRGQIYLFQPEAHIQAFQLFTHNLTNMVSFGRCCLACPLCLYLNSQGLDPRRNREAGIIISCMHQICI